MHGKGMNGLLLEVWSVVGFRKLRCTTETQTHRWDNHGSSDRHQWAPGYSPTKRGKTDGADPTQHYAK